MKSHYFLKKVEYQPHLLKVVLTVSDITSDTLNVRLSAWRPGRYELANYAKNIVHFEAEDVRKNTLNWKKTARNTWEIDSKSFSEIKITYTYYCQQLDAGACWIDDNLFYINPVNCLMYAENPNSGPCAISLNIDSNWNIAWNLEQKQGVYIAESWEKLADSPLLVAPKLTHLKYSVHQTNFHIWCWNAVNLDAEKIIQDFSAFTEHQLKLFGDFPFKAFHFLCLFPDYKHYHGVEHLESTVIVLGPTEEVSTTLYTEFLGVSSHELFHTWNVKTIRPIEMQPYNYQKENYSELGFVYEGFTTYYGDLMLFRSQTLDTDQYFDEVNTYLLRHSLTEGASNYAVSQSSFDTWVDGYVMGTPNRKSSIYIEGALNAFILDLEIRKSTQNNCSLDTLMQILYQDFGKKEIGYNRKDLEKILVDITQKEWSNHFDCLIYSPTRLENQLNDSLAYIGCTLETHDTVSSIERFLGVKFNPLKKGEVLTFSPNSPAAKNGISNGCVILKIDDMPIQDFEISSSKSYSITYKDGIQRVITNDIFIDVNERFYRYFTLRKSDNPTSTQKENYYKWSGNPF